MAGGGEWGLFPTYINQAKIKKKQKKNKEKKIIYIFGYVNFFTYLCIYSRNSKYTENTDTFLGRRAYIGLNCFSPSQESSGY